MTATTGQEFMEKTIHRHLEASDQSKGLPQPPLELGHKGLGDVIDLPDHAELPDYAIGLRAAIDDTPASPSRWRNCRFFFGARRA
jgi:hypothetical protein